METQRLSRLLDRYRQAPQEFHATRYWSSYERLILDEIARADFNELRSGKYPVFARFGFNDTEYPYLMEMSGWRRFLVSAAQRFLKRNACAMPYRLTLASIQEMAYRHCELLGQLSGARPICELGMSTVGSPNDLFEFHGRHYSMNFLANYVRYCFTCGNIPWTGREVIVELGSGSGYQVETLKKLFPECTVLCFDLPAQLFLCEEYLTRALGGDQVVSAETALDWGDLSGVVPGRVHFFGNWQMPLLKAFQFDVFWNAASFGEMEPEVVSNYLSFVRDSAAYVYLLQARHGKETSGAIRVDKKTTFADYNQMLACYSLVAQGDAYEAHRRMSQSGGYFQAVWKKV